MTFDPARFERAFDLHHQRVRHHFRDREGDLLVIDLCGGEGWDALCRFLGLPVPDGPFPWEDRLRASA
jgi:hypothetical protein